MRCLGAGSPLYTMRSPHDTCAAGPPETTAHSKTCLWCRQQQRGRRRAHDSGCHMLCWSAGDQKRWLAQLEGGDQSRNSMLPPVLVLIGVSHDGGGGSPTPRVSVLVTTSPLPLQTWAAACLPLRQAQRNSEILWLCEYVSRWSQLRSQTTDPPPAWHVPIEASRSSMARDPCAHGLSEIGKGSHVLRWFGLLA